MGKLCEIPVTGAFSRRPLRGEGIEHGLLIPFALLILHFNLFSTSHAAETAKLSQRHLFIMADDQGAWITAGCYGAKIWSRRTLTRWRRVRFTQFYSRRASFVRRRGRDEPLSVARRHAE